MGAGTARQADEKTSTDWRGDGEDQVISLETPEQGWSKIENMKVCAYRTDTDGRWTFLESAWTAITGFSVAQNIGRPFYDLFHPEEREKCREPFRRLIAGELESDRGQLRYFTKQGELRWLEVHIRPLLAADGTVSGTTGILLDVTDRVLVYQAIASSERRYRQLFRSSRAVKMVVDPDDGRIIDANKAAADFYGYSVSELKTLRMFDLSATPAEGIRKYLTTARGSKSHVYSPVQHRLKDGSLRYVEAFTTSVKIGGKTLLHPIIFDVTARRRLEAELAKSQERLELVLDGAKAGVWDWDMAGGSVYYDKCWKAILGYADDEIGSGFEEWRSRWHPADAARIDRAMADYREGRTDKYAIEHRLRHKDGSYRWILATGKITCDRLGRAIRWTGFNIDITDRKLTEELLVASETKLRDFAQAVLDASFIVDEDGLCVEAFGNTQKLVALAQVDLPGRTVRELLPADEAGRLLEEIRQTTDTGQPCCFAWERLTDGPAIIFEGRTAPMKHMVNGKKTVALVVNDVTERHQAEKMLDYAYRLRRRNDFINDMIEGKSVVYERDRYYAQTLGLDSPAPTFCCVIINDLLDSSTGYHRGGKSLDMQKLKEKSIQALDELANAIAWDCRDGIGVFCRLPAGGGSAADSLATAAAIKGRLQPFFPESPLFVGVSDIYNPAGNLGKMYREAYCSVLAARCDVDAKPVIHYRDAGIFQFLPAVGSRELAMEFVERQLGRLLEYDWHKGTDYLVTLAELLRGASVRKTAEKLFLHPKTLLFRRKRIEAMLRVSLEAPETRLALALAIKLLRLYNKF